MLKARSAPGSCLSGLALKVSSGGSLAPGFTRFRAEVFPTIFECFCVAVHIWVCSEDLRFKQVDEGAGFLLLLFRQDIRLAQDCHHSQSNVLRALF